MRASSGSRAALGLLAVVLAGLLGLAGNVQAAPLAKPELTSFAPASGSAGASVVITGTGLAGVTSVLFNGTTAAFHVDSPTQITAVMPMYVTNGNIRVFTPRGNPWSVAKFTRLDPAPAEIFSLDHTSGPVGSVVDIHGIGLAGVTAVRFNGVPAVEFQAYGHNEIQAVIPPGATSGSLRITVPAGEIWAPIASFAITTVPKFTSVTYASGSAAAGYTYQLNGSGLSTVQSVIFNGGTQTFRIVSDSQLEITVQAADFVNGHGVFQLRFPASLASGLLNSEVVAIPSS